MNSKQKIWLAGLHLSNLCNSQKILFCISFNILQSIYLGQIFAADVICLECTPQQVQLGIEAFASSTVVFPPQSDSDYDQSQYGNEKWIFFVKKLALYFSFRVNMWDLGTYH